MPSVYSQSSSLEKNLVGTVSGFAAVNAPKGWLKCNGAEVDRVLFSKLFAVIGEQFGAGDGSTTFNLPDLRGEFLRGFDDGRGVDVGRVFGVSQAATEIANEVYQQTVVGIRNHDGDAGSYSKNGSGVNSNYAPNSRFYKVRPINHAVLYCIKY